MVSKVRGSDSFDSGSRGLVVDVYTGSAVGSGNITLETPLSEVTTLFIDATLNNIAVIASFSASQLKMGTPSIVVAYGSTSSAAQSAFLQLTIVSDTELTVNTTGAGTKTLNSLEGLSK